MAGQNLVPTGPQAPSSMIESRRSIAALVDRRNAIIEAIKSVMKVGVDFGVIPGTPKPTLYKPGSEKILSMFGFSVTPTVEDLSTPDTIRYRVHAAVTNVATGEILGVGIGEASSAESKYQWRRVVCREEWDETPEDRRRLKWKEGKNGTYYSVQQVRAEMEDIANTVLKMAKKRAQIDATLTVTAASDFFSQDVADLKESGFDLDREDAPPAQEPRQELEKKPVPSAAPPGEPVVTTLQAKRFWAVALERTNDYKQIMSYLKDVLGIPSKDLIPESRYEDAMKWAEKGIVD